MKISQLKIKNILGIEEIDFEPGNIVVIKGKTGSGKTSILEAIQRTFTNNSERNTFVKTGAESGEIYIELDDNVEIRKKFDENNKPKNVNIKVDGKTVNAKESFLKGLINDAQLNPIEIIKASDKELSEMILKIFPIKITPELLDTLDIKINRNIDYNEHGLSLCKKIEKYLYEDRTDLNREIKNLETEIASYKKTLPEGYNVNLARSIDLKSLFDQISEANKINNNISRAKANIETSEERIKGTECEKNLRIAELQKQIELIEQESQNRIEEEKNKTKMAEEYISRFTEIDISELEKEYKEKEYLKSFIRTYDEASNKSVILSDKIKEAEKLTEQIEIMRNKPKELIKEANINIDGLEIDDGAVLVYGRPIINLSGGERIKFVMNIVRLLSGNLKTILINGFEALNETEQENFIKECENDGYQYIITKIGDSDLQITNL